jgi:hypothetical protein
VLTRGSYGILRSEGWQGNELIFAGQMAIIGIHCEWQIRWNRISADEFRFVNEERGADNSWVHIDEWRFEQRIAAMSS